MMGKLVTVVDKMAEDEGLIEDIDGGEWSPVPEHTIIRAPGSNTGDQDEFLEDQLEDALEEGIPYIIIEPSRIGDETTKWIQMGNFLHKTTVLAGLGCLTTGLTLPTRYKNFIHIPLGAMSLSSVILYTASWQYDPCCKYQVENDRRTLESLHIDNLSSNSVVVLKRRDDKYRKRLHNFIALMVASYFGWNVYKLYNSS